MTTKREKHYTVGGKLKIIDRFNYGKSKATLFCECGIPEGMICCWMEEDKKLHSFI
jgi:hypothetical protein